MASIRPDMMNKCHMQLFRKRPRMASIRPDMMKKCQMQLFLKTASKGLERPRRSDWGRRLKWPQVGPWNVKKRPFFKMGKITILASDGLGGRIWGHPIPLNRGLWATFDFSHDLEKCFLLWFFGTPSLTYQLTASEAAEADLIWPKTSAPTRSCYMASFSLLALTVWLFTGNIQKYRQKGGFQIYV